MPKLTERKYQCQENIQRKLLEMFECKKMLKKNPYKSLKF